MVNAPEFEICGRRVGYNHAPLVIAEIGINHGGSVEVAKQMVEAAISAGAEVIKHQTHIVEDEMTDLAKTTLPGNARTSIYEIIEQCSLSCDEEWELLKFTRERGAIFISTPFSRAAADRLANFDIPAFKIGSGECNNYPLLEHVAAFGKPIILSTGMNDLTSITKAVDILRQRGVSFALLHTTNLYPTPPHLVRLGALTELAAAFPDAVIGLSDHTTDNLACFGAVALGASILERHFTDSMTRHGPDIACSMDPDALRELIRGSRILSLERGGTKNSLLPEEQVTRDFAFATVVAIREIGAGELLTRENIWVKRPGTGAIKAEFHETLIGRRARRTIAANEHLGWEDLY